ncbi:MAG: hypothetical protein LBS99_06725 [Clostridiales bacterium]|jgi:1-acyl-sn-glycerol-3-phosphate acyltransferase/DNA-directed RNA polymerase subunit RPC12/RpoP|nr:hypothetical protein [Clostridiales bacterium]
MNINYGKNVKFYDMAKKPLRQAIWTIFVIIIASVLTLAFYKRKLHKVNMKGLKPPYLMLCSHMQFLDFMVAAAATFPHRMSNVISIDGYNIWPWLLEKIGSIPKRKFTNGATIVRQIGHVLKNNKNIVCMYPEARYSNIGVESELPDSIAKLIKLYKVPVVTMIFKGHYLNRPTWGIKKKRKVPIEAVEKCILTAEQVKEMSVAEIDGVLTKEFCYDEYRYQKDNNIQITEPFRAEGLHKVLYKCPSCGEEFLMKSSGAVLSCASCGVEWELKTNGELNCLSGETRFCRPPDWYEWQREEVRKEIDGGTYGFSDTMEAFSMPHPKRFIPLGKVTFKHGLDGFNIEGNYNGKDFSLVKVPAENYSVHVEYAFPYLKGKDIVSLSTNSDTLFMIPTDPITLQKLSLAAEELYKAHTEAVRLSKLAG